MTRYIDPAASGIVRGKPCTLSNMSIVLGLISPKDIVIVSDGLGIWEDGRIASEKYQKSVVLNQRICLASTGNSRHLRDLLAALDPRCADLGEDFPEEEFEKKGWTINKKYSEARSILTDAYSSLSAEWIEDYKRQCEIDPKTATTSQFLLCGRDKNGPSMMWFFVLHKDSGEIVPNFHPISAGSGVSPAILGVLGNDPLYKRLQKIMCHNNSLVGAEQRLVRAVRLVAEEKRDMRLGSNVLVRRMSKGFKPTWVAGTSN